MKKTIICNIPMKKDVHHCVYQSSDSSIPSSEKAVMYPVNAYLESVLSVDEEVKLVLLLKHDKNNEEYYKRNADNFVEEFCTICGRNAADVEVKLIETEFEEEKLVHEKLLKEIVAEIDDNSNVVADITYGSKDVPIVLFAALTFAEKYLNCMVDEIVYGQATIKNNMPSNTKLCSMLPLFLLNSVVNLIQCADTTKARRMLDALLSLK